MATQAKGSRTKIIYDCEATFKTTRTPTPNAHVLPFVSESVKASRNLLDSQSIRGDRNMRSPVRGNKDVAGDITVELDPYMGKMLYNVLGTFSTTGASPYSHTFKVSDLPAGITIEKQFLNLDTPQYFLYNGCKINSMKMSVKPEGFVETVFNIIGAKSTETVTSFCTGSQDFTSSTTAYGGPFTGFEATIQQPTGSSLGTVTNFEFTVENNLDASVFVIDGTGEKYSLPEGLTKVSGTCTCLFDSMAQYATAVAGNETSLRITLTKGTGAGSAGNEKLDIFFDEILFSPNAPVISGPQGIVIELPFTAYYQDGANSTACRFILWNVQTNQNIWQ